MNKTAARQVSDLLTSIGQQLVASIEVVNSSAEADEAAAYRRFVAELVAGMHGVILRPLYAEHPELVPEELAEHRRQRTKST
jgi:hypothetical protein